MNKNDKQYSLSLVVIYGTTDLASRMGTNGLIKQEKFTKITITNIVKCMKNCDMISFALFTFRMFSSHRFRLVYFSYCDFSYFSLSESWFCTLSLGQIDGSWFDHQRLWALLMFPIGIGDFSTAYNYAAWDHNASIYAYIWKTDTFTKHASCKGPCYQDSH